MYQVMHTRFETSRLSSFMTVLIAYLTDSVIFPNNARSQRLVAPKLVGVSPQMRIAIWLESVILMAQPHFLMIAIWLESVILNGSTTFYTSTSIIIIPGIAANVLVSKHSKTAMAPSVDTFQGDQLFTER